MPLNVKKHAKILYNKNFVDFLILKTIDTDFESFTFEINYGNFKMNLSVINT